MTGTGSTWIDRVVVDDEIAMRYPAYQVVQVAALGVDVEALRPCVDDVVERANEVAAEWAQTGSPGSGCSTTLSPLLVVWNGSAPVARWSCAERRSSASTR